MFDITSLQHTCQHLGDIQLTPMYQARDISQRALSIQE
jgi:hypothetical protein